MRFELPDGVESKGYSTATLALMDGGKLSDLGWNAQYSIQQGIERTLSMVRANKIANHPCDEMPSILSSWAAYEWALIGYNL